MITLHENKHITERYTLAEIKAKMDDGEYSADLLLHHLCLHANDIQRENARLRELVDELKVAACALPMGSDGYERARRAVAKFSSA